MKRLLIILAILTSMSHAEWQIETVGGCSDPSYTSLTLDSTNNPHIASVSGIQTVKYAYWDNPNWQVDTVIDVSGGDIWLSCTSLALDSFDDPHLTFAQSGFFVSYVNYAYWDGSNWQIESPIGYSSCFASLELDSSDYPCFPYVSWWGLEYACWDGSNWQNGMVDSLSDAWYITSLELDSSEFPHISYYNYVNADLKYASWDGSVWQTEIVDSEDHVGLWSSLKLDLTGHPHIAYSDSTNRDLKYAYWDGSVWQIETVDSIGAVGQWVSLDLYSTGYPCISYYDNTNEDLKYAYWDGSDWQIETVDSDGSVGQYTSLELDSAGHAHISYVDATNYNLKYAYQYVTGIEGLGDVEGCYLLPLSPNPASGTLSVEFSVLENAMVELSIYDMSGRLVKQSIPTTYSSGLHQISFSGLETGVYLCKMISGDFTATQQFVVIE